MGGPLSFLLQKHFSILVLKYIKRQRGGGMNDFSQKQFSHHTVTHFNTDPPLVILIASTALGIKSSYLQLRENNICLFMTRIFRS